MAFLCPKLFCFAKPKDRYRHMSNTTLPSDTSLNRNPATSSRKFAISDTPPDDFMSQFLVAKHTFVSCCRDELSVKKGDIVKNMGREGQWLRVMNMEGDLGCVPCNYLTTQLHGQHRRSSISSKSSPKRLLALLSWTNSPTSKAKLEKDELHVQARSKNLELTKSSSTDEGSSLAYGEMLMNDLDVFIRDSDSESDGDVESVISDQYFDDFEKLPHGRFLVVHSYYGEGENDVTVIKGECVTVLNTDDREWYWVLTETLEEGYVPSSHLWQATVEL